MSESLPTLIEGFVQFGYAQAAIPLGQPSSLYRPTNPAAPLGTLLATLPAAFSVADLKFTRPEIPNKPFYSGVWPLAQTQPGDYIVGPQGTFFIASQNTYANPYAIRCNRVLSVFQPSAEPVDGLQGGVETYGGQAIDTRVSIAAGWPAAIVPGTKGEAAPDKLPMDTRLPWWLIYLPPSFTQTISTTFEMEDDLGVNYVVSSPLQSGTGWIITAQQAST